MSTAPDVAVEEMTRGLRMITLKSIIPNAEDVRVSDIDGVPHLWAVNLAMTVTGENRKDAGEMLGDLKQDIFDSENFQVKKIAGNGK